MRARRPLGMLGGIRLQLQAGIVSTPNFLDADSSESAAYGEIQLGDTYVPFSELRRGRFRSAGATRKNAVRPYVKYRFSSVHEDLLEQHKRSDHRATAGFRYRRIPYTVQPGYSENGIPDTKLWPGAYFEVRAEVSKVWSSQGSEDLWNPRVQFDLYGPPFWNGTRFVFRATAEMNLYDHALAPDGDKRIDTRLRAVSGLDLSEPLRDQFDLPDGSVQAELLGRLQQRWSNDPGRKHTRLYFVPSLNFTVPFQ